MRNIKSQSAMEYLMTYGWAILIIAIALVALWELGVFNPWYFAPRAYPGSCNVYRPNGPGTTFQITLDGDCRGEIPQFVTYISPSSYLEIDGVKHTPYLTSAGQNAITITMWASPSLSGHGSDMVQYDGLAAWEAVQQPYPNLVNSVPSYACDEDPICQDPGVAFNGGDPDQPLGQDAAPYTNIGQMAFYVLEYSGNTLTIYTGVNGAIQPCTASLPCSAPLSLGSTEITSPGRLTLGYGELCCGYEGFMSNLQVYGTALSENSVSALYLEGVGGAPIDLEDLDGWWPLNGNTNDYSGDGSAHASWTGSTAYIEDWISTYTQP